MAATEKPTPIPIPAVPDFKLPDPEVVSRTMADVAERSQRIVGDWLKRQAEGENGDGSADATSIGRAFLEMTTKLMADPAALLKAQIGFWQDSMTLWQNTTRRMMGIDTPETADASGTDRRFKDKA